MLTFPKNKGPAAPVVRPLYTLCPQLKGSRLVEVLVMASKRERNFARIACSVESVKMCGMTLPEGTPERNQGGFYATNALLLKAERYSQ